MLKLQNSEILDHKAGRASRPVVTGCNSNTRGMSNSVSDGLESVNKANKNPYKVISGEDMLAKVENYNIKAAEIIKEAGEKLCKKISCKNTCHIRDGITRIARCDKLWRQKSSKARGEEQVQEETTSGNECWVDKTEEVMRYRRHQYMENPVMRVCPVSDGV